MSVLHPVAHVNNGCRGGWPVWIPDTVLSMESTLYSGCPDRDIARKHILAQDSQEVLTHWGQVTHICISEVSELIIIGSDNGLSRGRRQAIIWSNAGILSIGTLGTNFSEIFIEILTFSFKNMRLKVSSGKWRPFCLGPNVLSGVHTSSVRRRGCLCCCLYLEVKLKTWWIGA